MKGLIIGAGIGGLSASIALRQRGIETVIYESSIRFKDVGAGILMPPNAMYVLSRLGISEKITRKGHLINSLQIMNKRGCPLSNSSSSFKIKGVMYRTVSIRRSELHDILYSKVPNNSIKLNHKANELKHGSNGITVVFQNGNSVKGNFLIGSDGMRSSIRSQIFPNSKLRDSGQICWRGICKINLDHRWSSQLTELWGNGSRFGFVKINDSSVYWYATLNKTQHFQESDDIKNYLLYTYSKYISIVRDIILNTDEHTIITKNLYDLYPLNKWYHKSTVLIGDAAHAATPNLGQGGAQAIEDSYAIARHMSQTETTNLSFQAFQFSRNKKVSVIVNISRTIGLITNLKHPFSCLCRDILMKCMTPFFKNKQAKALYGMPNT